MESVDQKLEIWKNKLLDLGKRNRLLNYKETAKSSLKITFPSYEQLFDMLVRKENSVAFPYPINTLDIEAEDSVGPVSEAEADFEDYGGDGSCLRTNKKLSDLQKVLRNLRNKAKTSIEEQGVNVLYLSFGFLKWKEAQHSDYIYSSPLILVPVTLSIASIVSPYELSLHEDEIVINPTLAYKLYSDFGITLPQFDDDQPLDEYFDAIREKVESQGWSVSQDVSLSILSFLKINMYADLDNHCAAVASSPIVRALCGDHTALASIPDDIVNYDFDKNDRPKDVFQILDADASQQEAILLAKRGVSFILQGPPGTGKSQTITNIIAESLAAGKKVLFVAEKMAALEVVHKRLAAAGLDDFCLVLHSHKTKKRDVLDQLDNVLQMAQKRASETDDVNTILHNLQHDKQKLNDYAKQVFDKNNPLGKSIYEANGIIANLTDYSDIIFAIPSIKSTSKAKYDEYLFNLNRYTATIGKMTGDYLNNPWRNANLPAVTYEFRHDASAKLSKLLPVLKETGEIVNGVFRDIYSIYPETWNGMAKAEEVLKILAGAYEVPVTWVIGADDMPLNAEIHECSEMQKKCTFIAAELETLYSSLANQGLCDARDRTELLDVEIQRNELDKITSILSYKVPYFRWSTVNIDAVEALASEAKKQAEVVKDMKERLAQDYLEDIFDIDYSGIMARFKTEYTSIFKVFKSNYKEDKKKFLLNSKQFGRKINDTEMISVLQLLEKLNTSRQWYSDHEVQLNDLFGNAIESEQSDYLSVENEIASYKLIQKVRSLLNDLNVSTANYFENEEKVKQHFEFLYKGLFTDWEQVKAAWSWAERFKEIARTEQLNPAFITKICSSNEYVQRCSSYVYTLNSRRNILADGLDWIMSCFDDTDFKSYRLEELYSRLEACRNNFSLLEEWIDYRSSRKNCMESGLGDFIKAIETNHISAKDVVPIFKKRFYRLWLDSVEPDYPAVINFRRKEQDSTIKEFAELDKVQFNIAKARIKGKLINALPLMDHFTNGVDEISILRREINKRSRLMPTRKLFKEIPNLLLTLKPCLMMSPLSVSLFLEAESYKFDIVIFDEASQVYSENAIGAIARGKQVVITGDSKQLPPTNFFQAATSENIYDSEDDDEDIPVFDSILDEANMLPERTLRWHYRSRHESLIAFSNTKIYRNNLITFPSNIERGKDIGVEYIYVPEGVYDRGGKKGNVLEAKKVASLVFDHIRNNRNRSLGVIAFGEVQQYAIEAALREMRLANQECEDFFKEGAEEPFFIKSLENVQGDERDTIIFSIGYARDSSGNFRMNFGPLGKSGGERRLNVAITRAKYNIKLVGSIHPTDINTDAITTEGPRLLRSYIDYAMNGESVLAREIQDAESVEFDSPFEEAVYNYLDKNGYKLSTQVGCSGYRIDIGVKHPRLSGVYVLGVECDGASYHSAKTARERDRLRQDVLENMGWSIYRIWSTDWIKDPATEGKRLIDAIENAVARYDSSAVANTERITAPTPSEFVNIEIAARDASNPYGFEQKLATSFSNLPRDRSGYLDLADCITAVIENEYPVHYELLCQRVAGLLGNENATVRVRREVDCALSKMNNYIRKDDFMFPKGYKKIPVRMPNERKIQHIHTEEIASAMIAILRTCVGATRNTLSDETTRVYGFLRKGQQISAAMASSINYLLDNGYVEELEGKLRIKQ